jgi:aspartate/methionine/tyrosine aminotransferase
MTASIWPQAEMTESVRGAAPYMEWSKKRPAVAYDLAGSNLHACTLADLPGALEAIRITGDNTDGYTPLIEAIASRYGVSADRVATASGAGGANYLAMAALVEPGDEVLVERPAYDPILGALRFFGAHIVRFDRTFMDAWIVDAGHVIEAMTARTRLVVLSSPHNPSGVLASESALEAIGAAAARIGARVMVDEVYLDSVYTNRPRPAATRGDVFVSTSSLTKAYGLSSLRAGWILAEPAVVERINRTRDSLDGGGPLPSDTLALHAFGMLDQLEARARSILEPNLEMLTRFIESCASLEWVRPEGGNVAFPLLNGVEDTRDLAARLVADHDTAIVPGHFFDSPSHFRIAFGAASGVFEAGLDRLARSLETLAGAR